MRNKRRGESNGGKYSCALCFLHAFDLVSTHFKSGHSFVMGQNQEAWDQKGVVGGGKFPAPGQFVPESGAPNFRRETWEG